MIEMDVVAEDLWFPEGPIAMADGSVLLVEIRRQTLTRVHPDGSTEIVANFDGGPNGAAIGPDGACYVVNNGGFAYVKHEDGTLGPNGFPSDDYVSGSVQRVDLATGEVVWSSAGFPPVLRIGADGVSERFPAEGPPLGILRGMAFPVQSCNITDASLYLFSDGVTDVRDARGKTVDVDGIEHALRGLRGLRAEARLRDLIRQLRGLRVTDDITFMLLQGRAAGTQLLLEHHFPADPLALAQMRHRLGDALIGSGASDDDRGALVLALDEAASNVIRHVYRGPCDQQIELRVERCGSELRFELRDNAPCIDPSGIKPRDLTDARPGGLGINIIDALMDAWHMEPLPGGGNRLLMRKDLRRAATAA